MARWRLTSPHYLNIKELDGEPVEFRYTEQSLQTMRNRTKSFLVPILLDPRDPTLVNDPDGIIVSYEKGAYPRDYIFFSDPTPEMQPLDEEAEAISESLRPKWINPIEALPSNGDYSQSLISVLERQIEAMGRMAPDKAPAIAVTGVSQEDFAKLQATVAELAARNAELEAAKPTETRR